MMPNRPSMGDADVEANGDWEAALGGDVPLGEPPGELREDRAPDGTERAGKGRESGEAATATSKGGAGNAAERVGEDAGEEDSARVLGEILHLVRFVAGIAQEGMAREGSAAGESVAAPSAPEETSGGDDGAGAGPREAAGEAAEIVEERRGARGGFGRGGGGGRRLRRGVPGRGRGAARARAAGFPAALLLGVLVEQQFQVIPLHDPTGGWRGHIWDNYGRTIVDCVTDAMRTNAEVNCQLVVRRP